jgi:hypothetical protein
MLAIGIYDLLRKRQNSIPPRRRHSFLFEQKTKTMKIASAAYALLFLSPVLAFDGSISADSAVGQKLLGKARQLQNNNNYNY